MRRAILLVVLAAIMGGFHEWSPARGAVHHILGWDGPKVALDATCRRSVVAPPGETVKMGLNVTAQQVKCLIRRPDPFARCVRRLGVPPIVRQINKDDWTNVSRLDAYVASVYACSHAHLR